MATGTGATRILFDFDGTLVQTRTASWEVFRGINEQFGLGIDSQAAYFALMEDNLFESLRRHIRDEAKADAVTAAFLSALERDYHPQPVPGIVDVIHALTPHAVLAVLSSNATPVMRRVLTENGIDYCFSHVFGGDVVEHKTEGIRRFLGDAAAGAGRMCEAPYDGERGGFRPMSGIVGAALSPDTVLVTDTVGDVAAALAAGVRAVGVCWGMHSADQLLAAGAEFVAVWPQELISHLRAPATGGARQESGACAVPGAAAAAGSSSGCGCGCPGKPAEQPGAAAPAAAVVPQSTAGAVRQTRPRPARTPDVEAMQRSAASIRAARRREPRAGVEPILATAPTRGPVRHGDLSGELAAAVARMLSG